MDKKCWTERENYCICEIIPKHPVHIIVHVYSVLPHELHWPLLTPSALRRPKPLSSRLNYGLIPTKSLSSPAADVCVRSRRLPRLNNGKGAKSRFVERQKPFTHRYRTRFYICGPETIQTINRTPEIDYSPRPLLSYTQPIRSTRVLFFSPSL